MKTIKATISKDIITVASSSILDDKSRLVINVELDINKEKYEVFSVSAKIEETEQKESVKETEIKDTKIGCRVKILNKRHPFYNNIGKITETDFNTRKYYPYKIAIENENKCSWFSEKEFEIIKNKECNECYGTQKYLGYTDYPCLTCSLTE